MLDSADHRILIVGASARAAAFSACRAGYSVSAIDLFGDQDLRDCAAVQVAQDYPASLPGLAGRLPPCPWLYTGGLENHPTVVDRLAVDRPLLGSAGNVLRQVRDPFQLARCVRRAGFVFPEITTSPAGLPTDGSWLKKGFRSSGGHQVRPWLGEGVNTTEDAPAYYQKRVEGQSCAAVYLSASRKVHLLGVTRQLVGLAWCGAEPFHYCGSIGPFALAGELHQQFEKLGDCIAAEFGLRGLFGLDVIVEPAGSAGGTIWPIEVNPRYPASAEVLERALGVSMIGLHVAACQDGELPMAAERARGCAGKAILFARRDWVVTADMAEQMAAENIGLTHRFSPRLADLPVLGSTIEAGWPLFTLLEDGSSLAEVVANLQRRAQSWQRSEPA